MATKNPLGMAAATTSELPKPRAEEVASHTDGPVSGLWFRQARPTYHKNLDGLAATSSGFPAGSRRLTVFLRRKSRPRQRVHSQGPRLSPQLLMDMAPRGWRASQKRYCPTRQVRRRALRKTPFNSSSLMSESMLSQKV